MYHVKNLAFRPHLAFPFRFLEELSCTGSDLLPLQGTPLSPSLKNTPLFLADPHHQGWTPLRCVLSPPLGFTHQNFIRFFFSSSFQETQLLHSGNTNGAISPAFSLPFTDSPPATLSRLLLFIIYQPPHCTLLPTRY